MYNKESREAGGVLERAPLLEESRRGRRSPRKAPLLEESRRGRRSPRQVEGVLVNLGNFVTNGVP